MSSTFWTIADECLHYADLGCHIASIARYFKPPKNNKDKRGKARGANTANTTTPYISALHASCLECKEDMYNCAMQQHPWLLGIEHFDPSEYEPSDLLNFPEIAMYDGVFDDEHGRYPKGTWLRSPHMSAHKLFSVEVCTILVKTGHLLKY